MKNQPRIQTAPAYAELSCKSNFSFLQGAARAEELVARAQELGLKALAITDENSLAGVVRAHVAAKEAHLKLVIGAEIRLTDAPPVLLHARNRAGYRNLAQLITHGRRAAPKGECQLRFSDLASRADHLFATVIPEVEWQASLPQWLQEYRNVFGKATSVAASLSLGPRDDAELAEVTQLARQARLPLLAVNHVQYHERERRPLHDVLAALRHGITVTELGRRRLANGERHLKSPAEMSELFARCPAALERADEIADGCCFSLDELRYDYPEELCPNGATPADYLAQLAWAGARQKYPNGIPGHVHDLLSRELSLIAELRYEAYFLTVWDLVREANRLGILCQGRGSAANSVVCFCLGITSVDPERIDLLFERFVSRERNEAPDIDVDFEHERREEIFQYIWRKYGRERAALTAEVVCYRPRSAVRDVGKALGISLDGVDRLAKLLGAHGGLEDLERAALEAGLDTSALATRQWLHLSRELMGFPRHLSQHVGGFVITRGPLADLVPIENAAMPERTVVQWDKNDLDALGILKVDCLALGMLTAIRKCFTLMARHHSVDHELATVPAEDPAVYDMLCAADTVGTFQVESRAQMSMLPRLRPRCFYDLVIQVAIVRPGPIQGGMVHPYLRRRNGEELIDYPTPEVRSVLEKTLGVPLFQEQAMRLAVVAAGFTPGEADQFRRAMGSWGRHGVIEKFRRKLLAGMLARGLSAEFAERLYAQLSGFGEYGFPESHAASFARLAYISAWLKCYYPACFTAALLNSQPMGFYAPAQLINDARAKGLEVLPPDVNRSDWNCTLEAGDTGLRLRLGLRLVRGLPAAVAEAVVAERGTKPYLTCRELAIRAGIRRVNLLQLAAADCFRSLKLSRRQALWQILALHNEELPLFAHLVDEEPPPSLPEAGEEEEMRADYDATQLSLKAHPMELLRPDLSAAQVTTAEGLKRSAHQQPVRVAGLVLVRQRPPTAKGTVFVTLEDETGMINLVVWRHVWERWRRQAQGAAVLLAEGRVERANNVVHVMPDRLENLALAWPGLHTRDFR